MTRKKSYQPILSHAVPCSDCSETMKTENAVTTLGRKKWLKRIRKWIKNAIMLGLLTGTANICVTPLMAQGTTDIGNYKTTAGYNFYGPADGSEVDNTTGTRPSPDGYDGWGIRNNWFGWNDTNNATYFLNAQGNGAVTIHQLDDDTGTAEWNTWYVYDTYSDAYYNTHYVWRTQHHTQAHGPDFDPKSWTNAYGGTINVTNANDTVRLNADYVAGPPSYPTTPGANYDSVPEDWRFDFNCTEIADAITKTGAGTLQFETNTYISKFIGNAGTLSIVGTTGGSKFARIDSGLVTFNGGSGTLAGTNGIDTTTSFRVTSGADGNTWTMTGLDGNGFHSDGGRMFVTGNATLDNTTIINNSGLTHGILDVIGTTSVGTVTGQSVLNVKNGGELHAHDTFTAASIVGANVYFNVNGSGSLIDTDNTASFATVAGSTVSGIISNAGTWTNTGTYTVAENGTATITVQDNNSKLTSTGDIIVGYNPSSVGTLIADNNGEITTDTNIYVGDRGINSGTGAEGNLTAKGGGKITAALNIEAARGLNTTAAVTAYGGTITASDGHFVLAASGTATMDVTNSGKVYVNDYQSNNQPVDAGNAYFGYNGPGYATGKVSGNNSLFHVDHNLTVGRGGFGLLYVDDKGKVEVVDDHIIADLDESGTRSFGRDVVSNEGVLEISKNLIVGNSGQAGGYYDYIGVGYGGGYKNDPTSKGTLGETTWVDSDHLTLTPKDAAWSSVENNSPGLAIVAGGKTTVGENAVVGKNAKGYGYVLLDNIDNVGTGRSTLDITGNFTVADAGEAYLRVINGSLVNVDGNMVIGNQGKDGSITKNDYVGHGTVRVSGSSTGPVPAELIVGGNLIAGNEAGSQGYLYVHEAGKVTVGGNHLIGNQENSFGRDHIDGEGSQLDVTGNLFVGNLGTAGGRYVYHIDGTTNQDPAIWFDSHNLLLEPGDGDTTLSGVTKNWDAIKDNAPGLALTDGAKGTADSIFAGISGNSFGYILIDDKGSSGGRSGLTATHNMTIADAGEAYTRVLNGGQLKVGTVAADSLTIGKTTGQGTLRVGDTTGGSSKSSVEVTGTLITAGNGIAGDIAEGYLYASDGSKTTVTGSHIVAQGQYSFGRDHFNDNGTTLSVTSAASTDQTVIGDAGQAGGHYRYITGGGDANDPTKNTKFSSNKKWFDSANLLLEPDQTTAESNVNYPTLTWDDVKNNSPGFALTAGAQATTSNEPVIVGNTATGYGYVLLDNFDAVNPSATNRTSWTTTGSNFTLGNAGDAYARVINGSLLSIGGNMIVANEGTSEATIRINGIDTAANKATLTVAQNLTVANATGSEGNLYAYQQAQVNVTNGNFTIANAANSYGRAHFDGAETTGDVSGTLTVGLSGQAGLAYQYVAHLQNSDGSFNNKLNDPEKWFDSVNTLDDDISDTSKVEAGKVGYTLNPNNATKTKTASLVQQNNAPGLLVSDGAKVTSDVGMVAQEAGSVGYVVIDNKGNASTRSNWNIQDGNAGVGLTIAEHGTAYVRVLNGALLNTVDNNNLADVIIADKNKSRGTLRVQDVDSELVVAGDLITAKNGAKGQENVAIGNFYLHDKATAAVTGSHTIAEGIYSEGRDHIDGNGTKLNINGTLTVAESGYAGNYVYRKGDSNNAKDPTHNGAEFNMWFDSANTLNDFNDPSNSVALKENMPGLAITAGAVVTSGDGMVAKNATTNTPTIPANATDTVYRSNGYFVIDNTGSGTGRSTWNIEAGLGNPASLGDLIVASEGTGYGRVISGALLDVANDMTIAEKDTGAARSRGTVRVYGTGNGNDSELKTGGDLVTAKEGTGSLFVGGEADASVTGDHTVAEVKGSYGNDHIDGHDTTLTVGGTLMVGDYGQAGGRYDYIGNGKAGGISKDPATWFDSDNTLLTPSDSGYIENNAPGLAITAGAVVTSHDGMIGQNRNADKTQGYGYVVIDSKDKTISTDRSKWLVQSNSLSADQNTNNTLTVAKNGEAYVRVINGSLLEVGKAGNLDAKMTIGSDAYGYGTVRVNNVDPTNVTQRPELIVHGDLTTGGNGTNNTDYATGNLYAHDQARIQVDSNHVIADGQYSVGRDHIDGVGTTMNVDRTLTVGKAGAAGGWYQENRFIIPSNEPDISPDQHYYADDPTSELQKDPERWLDHKARTLEDLDRTTNNLGSPKNAKDGKTTGNSPGLAITAGAVVTSGSGMIAEFSTANGYVLIDDKRVGADSKDDSVRTRWIVQNDGSPFGTDGKLVVGGKGNAFARVLNGALLQADSTTIAQSGGDEAHGYLYVIGGKENPKDANGNPVPRTDALTGAASTWQPSEWISKGATVLGEKAEDERGTLRIEEGAHGVTSGLYIGLAAGSQGEVSVSGTSASPYDNPDATRSLLEVYEDTSNNGKRPEGSSTLSVSDYGYLWMHQNSELRLNGVGIISNGAILHLSEASVKKPGDFDTDPAGIFTNEQIAQADRTALIDAMKSKVTIINARIEGDGIVTGEDGVFIAADPAHNTTGSETVVDPGQRYDWSNRDEYFSYYGKLTFGDQLRMTGDVTTNFDVNSGYYPGMGGAPNDDVITPQGPNYDAIVVTRGASSTSKADVLAQLSGTLNVHARLTDYYAKNSDLLVVQTIGDIKPGSILSVYDTLKVMPSRFFEDPKQEIRQDGDQNDQLWVTLQRKDNPFEESGNTHNEKETGKGLDSVYMDQINNGRKDWLPVLRYFWYLNDPEFLDAYRLFSGEVRAHSLLLPMTNQWRYAHNRMDFRDCNNPRHNHTKPCDETGVPEQYIRCGAAKNRWKERLHQLTKNARLWGSVIYDDMETDNDGNAADNRMHRYGVVVGADKPFLRPESYLGVMVGLDRGKLNSFQSRAQDDDLSIGLYHGTKLFETWEWKNYIGAGIQDYTMSRDVNVNLTDLTWRGDGHFSNDPLGDFGGSLSSDFLGYSLSGSTELARPFYFGKCGEYMFRPYMALDLAMVWQNSASEDGNFENSHLIALDYLSATNIRVFGRPGFLLERNGRHSSFHAGLSYAFLMGGRRYTDVDNRFQIGGDTFNIRGVDDGTGFATWNFGGNVYLGKRKHCSIILDYWGSAGSHSVTQSAQLGFQKKF